MRTPRLPTCTVLALLTLSGSALAQGDQLRLKSSALLNRVPASDPSGDNHAGQWIDQAGRWQPGGERCATVVSPPWDRLTLGDALIHVLCRSPSVRQAMSQTEAQSASVILSEQAARPSWSARLDYSNERNFNSSGNSGRTLGASIGFAWALFDFGQSSANLREARRELSATLAQADNAVLESVRTVLTLYGNAVVASASLEAATEAETTANQTAAAAQARYEAQVGSQIDRLQAQTALAQAKLERVRARGNWEIARGDLALALGADIEQSLRLAGWEALARPIDELPDLTALRRETLETHPRLRALRSQVEGQQARLEAVQAQGKGSVSLRASTGSSRNWGAAGSGSIPTASAALSAEIPLFNRQETRAQQTQVLSRKNAREAELESARREVESQLWQAHQSLLTSRQSLLASDQLLASAQGAYNVAQGRYRAGVGAILELLDAQSALANAHRQRVSAQIDQLNARTRLGLAVGRLGR